MFVHNIDPVALHLGALEIRWYGIIYALSFLIGYWYLKRETKKRAWSLDVDALFTYLIIGDIIGARLFHVFFYGWEYFRGHLLEIFYIWQGGLSFHGGLVGGLLAIYLFSRKHKVQVLALADILAIPLAFGLFLGRIANFLNGELYGFPTNLPWAVDFGDGVARHPTQLYESLKNLFIFGVLLLLKPRWKEKSAGLLFAVFLVLYGMLRFVIEFWKVPQTLWLGLPVGQWLSLLTVVAGIVVWLWSKRK